MIKLPSNKIRDIRGEIFGRLVVVEFSHIDNSKAKNAFWLCKCDCGNLHKVSSSALRSKSTISCGCYGKEVSRRLMKKMHNRGQDLYFVRSGAYVKIGRADNVPKRLIQLKAMNPHGVNLLLHLKNKGHLEKFYHDKFKNSLWSGEWFTLMDSEVISIGSVQDG